LVVYILDIKYAIQNSSAMFSRVADTLGFGTLTYMEYQLRLSGIQYGGPKTGNSNNLARITCRRGSATHCVMGSGRYV